VIVLKFDTLVQCRSAEVAKMLNLYTDAL